MGCNCGKKRTSSQPKKIIKTPSKPINSQNNTLKRIIRRSAY